ncbi:MAG: hypothetical protein U5J63_02375 [Fodinibius sp.]|nr:hypothetical protein [Fodinibius sp.]
MNKSAQHDPEQNADGCSYYAPEWARHVVWYQIFPERFCNGDSGNDPTRERVGGPEGWTYFVLDR